MRIKQIVLCHLIVGLALAGGGSALAAEPFGSQHVGIALGVNSSHGSDARTTGTPNFVALGPTVIPQDLSLEEQAIVASLAYGYDIKLSDRWMVGTEIDISVTNLDRKSTFSGAPITGVAVAGLSTTAREQVQFLSTLRGRIGYMPTDDTLLYLTGGLAAGHYETSASVVVNGTPTLAWQGQDKGLKYGWTLGAGVEYALSPSLSIKGEALYYDLGDVSVAATGNAAVRAVAALNGVDYVYKTDLKGIIARVGLNYRY